MGQPAYTRLDVDERRRRLLERGAELFEQHSYDELSMAQIVRAAGIAGRRPATPALSAAVRGWLWFMDGAQEDWLEHRDLDRAQLHSLLLGTLLGAVTAAGQPLGPR